MRYTSRSARQPVLNDDVFLKKSRLYQGNELDIPSLGTEAMEKAHEGSNRHWIFDVVSVQVARGIQISTLGENLSRWGR